MAATFLTFLITYSPYPGMDVLKDGNIGIIRYAPVSTAFEVEMMDSHF